MEGLESLLNSLLTRQVGMSIHEDPYKNYMDPLGILSSPQAQIYGPMLMEQKPWNMETSGSFGGDISMGGFEGRAPLADFNIQSLIDPNNTKLVFGLKPTDKYEQYIERDQQGKIIRADPMEMFNNIKFDPKDFYFNYRRDNENTGYQGPRTIQNFQIGPKRIGADIMYEFEPGGGITSLFK